MTPTALVLCATPRSGSTLLCGMLEATGVAGRPHSWFRAEDIADWAAAWGIAEAPDAPGFDRAYLAALRREASAGGVTALRLMAGSVPDATARLNRALGTAHAFPGAMWAAFGPTLHVHLARRDTVAQAVSLLRAERGGLWHRHADGTVMEGEATPRPVAYDRARLAALVSDLQAQEATWQTLFAAHALAPLRLLYEDLAADPQAALARILAALGLDPGLARDVPTPTARLADAESRAWAARFRREAPP